MVVLICPLSVAATERVGGQAVTPTNDKKWREHEREQHRHDHKSVILDDFGGTLQKAFEEEQRPFHSFYPRSLPTL